MSGNNKTKHIFYSITEIEKKYFPRTSQIGSEKQIKDARSLGIIIARSSLSRIKTLLVDRTDLS